jgi:hypothetical protein
MSEPKGKPGTLPRFGLFGESEFNHLFVHDLPLVAVGQVESSKD